MNGNGEDRYNDVVSETIAESADMTITSELFHCEFDSGQSTGIRTLGWPDTVVVISGTENEDNRATVGQMFTPEQARELAHGIEKAADKAERRGENEEPDTEDNKSVLRRLIE